MEEPTNDDQLLDDILLSYSANSLHSFASRRSWLPSIPGGSSDTTNDTIPASYLMPTHRLDTSSEDITHRNSLELARLGIMNAALYKPPTLTEIKSARKLQLRRSKSWSSPSVVPQPSVPIRRITETIIFSGYLEKLSTKGKWQKRIFRFDGMILACLTDKMRVTVPTGRPIAEFDLSNYLDNVISKDFVPLMRKNLSSKLVNSLIAGEISESRPNPNALKFHLPKWVILVSDIASITNKGDGSFTIKTNNQLTYTLRASKVIADRWISLLSKLRVLPHPTYQNFASLERVKKVEERNNAVLNTVRIRQTAWINALDELIHRQPNVSSFITTIFCEGPEIKQVRGLRYDYQFFDNVPVVIEQGNIEPEMKEREYESSIGSTVKDTFFTSKSNTQIIKKVDYREPIDPLEEFECESVETGKLVDALDSFRISESERPIR